METLTKPKKRYEDRRYENWERPELHKPKPCVASSEKGTKELEKIKEMLGIR